MPAWCSMKWIIWMACCFRSGSQDMTRFGFEDALVGQMVPTPD